MAPWPRTVVSLMAKKQLTVERWPQKVDRMNRLGLGIRQRLLTTLRFGYFFDIYIYFFLQFSEAILQTFLPESGTTMCVIFF